MPIPKRIIQTHYSKALAATSRASWLAHHPDFEYCFFNDAACRHFMAQHFANLVAVYDRLPLPVQKADMFRYAALLTLGGVYADADTLCCSSLPTYANLDSDMMLVGVEMRPDHYLDGIDTYSPTYPIPHQILQWTYNALPTMCRK
jgi:mannosyltransferase OCH1-like enzyme